MSDEDDVRALLQRFEDALHAGEAELAVGCYGDDGMAMAATMPTLAGRDHLLESYRQFVTMFEMDVVFTVDEGVVVSPTVAYALTRSNGTQKVKSRAVTNAEANRDVRVLSREDVRKIRRYMNNTAS